MYVAIVLILMLHMFSHICCNNMLKNISSVSVFCCSKCFHVASCKCSIWMLHMFSHICYKCMFHMFHLFQTCVAFKYFMLHVFHAVWRVRRASPSGRQSSPTRRRGPHIAMCNELARETWHRETS
jgi:hypothetical protein